MAQKMSNRGWLGLGFTVIVLGGLVVVAIWTSLNQSTNPDYQNQNDRSGIGEYYVNLWIDPQPPVTGEVEISTQLSTSIGSPIELESLDLQVQEPDNGSTEDLETEQTPDGPNDGPLYVANTTFDQPGTWRVLVSYSFGGPEVTDEFDIEVAE